MTPSDHSAMSKPRPPKPVIVDHLKASPFRPPSSRSPHWSWRCRKDGALLFSGRMSRAEVRQRLIEALDGDEAEPEAVLVETVGQVLDLWFTNEVEDRSEPGTVSTYKSSALRIVRLVGGLHVDRGRMVIDELHRLMDEQGWTRSTKQLTQTILIMAWRWAHLRNLVDEPAPPPKRLKKGEARRSRASGPIQQANRRTVPSLDEALTAIARVREPHRSILMVQLGTGARIGEVCALHVADVVEVDGRLVVAFGMHVGAQKTGPRDVPITSPDAEALLRRAVAEARLAGRQRLWVTRVGSRIQSSYAAKALRIIDWTGIGCDRFQTHALRYLAVYMARRSGVLPEVAAAIFGHSVAVMLEVYRSTEMAEMVEAMERMRLGEGGGVRGLR